MAFREPFSVRINTAAAGIVVLVAVLAALIAGCLQVEPEELPPLTMAPEMTVTETMIVPPAVTENPGSASRPIAISVPRQSQLFSEQDFPAEVKTAISDFSGGKTDDTINGFLRWESVRARTGKTDTAMIREQIGRIDYALYNTTIRENVSIYVGVSREQAKRIRNDSAYTEAGYIIGSVDPSVIYHQNANGVRDDDGYLTMCVLDFRKGDHLLFVNTTRKEYLIPRGTTWDVTGEETYGQLTFTADSIPRYDDIIQTQVRMIHTLGRPW